MGTLKHTPDRKSSMKILRGNSMKMLRRNKSLASSSFASVNSPNSRDKLGANVFRKFVEVCPCRQPRLVFVCSSSAHLSELIILG